MPQAIRQTADPVQRRAARFQPLQITHRHADHRNRIGRRPVAIHVSVARAFLSAKQRPREKPFVVYHNGGLQLTFGIAEAPGLAALDNFQTSEP